MSNIYESIKQKAGPLDELKRLFRLQGVRTLLNDLYIRVYPDYQFLILIRDGDYVSFMPKKQFSRCLTQGAALLSSAESFEKYLREASEQMSECKQFCESFIAKNTYTSEDVDAFFSHITKTLWYYRYTDYNFSDGAYRKAQETDTEEAWACARKLGDFKNDMRSYINELVALERSYFKRFLRKLQQRTGVEVSSLREYTREEILSLIEAEKEVSQETITKRKQATALFNDTGTVLIVEGQQAQELFEELTKQEDEQTDTETLRGVAASQGTATGNARVLYADYDDSSKLTELFSEMRQGEILISETTSPDLMPAITKASAIVTNQGGMLSHAAVISRELGIPCVVAIPKATKTIRTGDLVQVDADNGVVRIL